MSSDHRQSSYEKYGCYACNNPTLGDRHDLECPNRPKPQIEELATSALCALIAQALPDSVGERTLQALAELRERASK